MFGNGGNTAGAQQNTDTRGEDSDDSTLNEEEERLLDRLMIGACVVGFSPH